MAKGLSGRGEHAGTVTGHLEVSSLPWPQMLLRLGGCGVLVLLLSLWDLTALQAPRSQCGHPKALSCALWQSLSEGAEAEWKVILDSAASHGDKAEASLGA